jgi:hypothetical protein
LGEIRTTLAITQTQYSGGDQFFATFKYIMKDGRVFTNTNSNANVVGIYMRSPFKYTLNVVCPITESLAGAHTYVTTNMKAGTGGGVQAPLVEERSRELLHGQIQQQLEFTLHGSWIRSV